MTFAIAEIPVGSQPFQERSIDPQVAHAAALATLATMSEAVRAGRADLPYVQALVREGSSEKGVFSSMPAAHSFVSQGKDVVFRGATSPDIPPEVKDSFEYYAEELGRSDHPYATYTPEPPNPEDVLELVNSERSWSTMLFVATPPTSRLTPVRPVIVLGATSEKLLVTSSLHLQRVSGQGRVLDMRRALGLTAPADVRQRVSMFAVSHRLPDRAEDSTRLKVHGH